MAGLYIITYPDDIHTYLVLARTPERAEKVISGSASHQLIVKDEKEARVTYQTVRGRYLPTSEVDETIKYKFTIAALTKVTKMAHDDYLAHLASKSDK